METLIVILVAILVVAIYLMWRNNKVCYFRIEINHKCFDVLRNFIYSLKDDKELNERYEELEQLEMKECEIFSKHSYCSMLFSLKPLKLEHWYTNEEIEFMNLDFVSKVNNNPKITAGTKIRSKTNPDIILSIISNDCHEDEFECSNGSVLSLKQIEKYYDIII